MICQTAITATAALALALGCRLPSAAQVHAVDAENSTVTIRVFKSGLLSALGDNHEIRAPISRGEANEATGRVELVFRARDFAVVDPGLPPAKRLEIRDRMAGPDVLDAERYPEIRFQSEKTILPSTGEFIMRGSLSLHGQTKPVVVHGSIQEERYNGSALLKLRDFGIQPVSVAGGTVKIKDEVRIEFEVVLKPLL